MSVLERTTREHCEVKNLLKWLAFVVDSETTKSFAVKGGILEVFLAKEVVEYWPICFSGSSEVI